MMFGGDISNYKFENIKSALKSLSHKEVEAVIYVAGQPVEALSQLPEAAKHRIKLVAYNEKNPIEERLTQTYKTVEIDSSKYKWLVNNVPTLSTTSYLVTYDYKSYTTRTHIKKFLQKLKEIMPIMKGMASTDSTTPHPKWKKIQDICDSYKHSYLPSGWQYYSAVKEICTVSNNSEKKKQSQKVDNNSCTDFDRDLGLCNSIMDILFSSSQSSSFETHIRALEKRILLPPS